MAGRSSLSGESVDRDEVEDRQLIVAVEVLQKTIKVYSKVFIYKTFKLLKKIKNSRL